MDGFLMVFTSVIDWMRNLTIPLNVGSFQASISLFDLAISLIVVDIGITLLKKIFDW